MARLDNICLEAAQLEVLEEEEENKTPHKLEVLLRVLAKLEVLLRVLEEEEEQKKNSTQNNIHVKEHPRKGERPEQKRTST